MNQDQKLPASLKFVAEASLPTAYAVFRMRVYLADDGKEHVAIVLGDVSGGNESEAAPLARLHSECLTGDVLFSMRCDCGFQLEHAMQRIAAESRGVLLYLRQEGRGIGLVNKIRAYALQDQGHDTVDANTELGFPADARNYDVATTILKDLGVSRLRLLTNNPRKVDALTADGIDVTERMPIVCGRNPHNEAYLGAKLKRLGHFLEDPATEDSQ